MHALKSICDNGGQSNRNSHGTCEEYYCLWDVNILFTDTEMLNGKCTQDYSSGSCVIHEERVDYTNTKTNVKCECSLDARDEDARCCIFLM